MINYSFIIPHKNIPQLLRRCLNSIPERNDIEIIVIDDNSDKSPINEELISQGRRNIKFIYVLENRGAGYARNKGIEAAQGKWLVFADADDFFTTNIVTVLKQFAEDSTTDLVYLNAQAIDDQRNTSPLPIETYISNFLNKKLFAEKVLRYKIWAPWVRMVRHDLVMKNTLKFDEIFVGNDAMFSLKCSMYAEKIRCVTNCVYNYYRPNLGSNTAKYYTQDNLKSILDLYFRINKLYSDVGFPLRCTFLDKYLALPSQTEDQKRYKAQYYSLLEQHNYNRFSDVYHIGIRKLFKLSGLI